MIVNKKLIVLIIYLVVISNSVTYVIVLVFILNDPVSQISQNPRDEHIFSAKINYLHVEAYEISSRKNSEFKLQTFYLQILNNLTYAEKIKGYTHIVDDMRYHH